MSANHGAQQYLSFPRAFHLEMDFVGTAAASDRVWWIILEVEQNFEMAMMAMMAIMLVTLMLYQMGRVSNIKGGSRLFFPLWDGCINSTKNIWDIHSEKLKRPTTQN